MEGGPKPHHDKDNDKNASNGHKEENSGSILAPDNDDVQHGASELPPATLYKYHYTNIESGKVVFTRETKEPLKIQTHRSSEDISVLEVITDVTTSWSPKEGSIAGRECDLPPAHEESKIHEITRIMLKINSPAIISALQSVVEYYPALGYFGKSISMVEPYNALVHHEDELAELRSRFNPGMQESEDQMCERNVNMYEHRGILQSFLQESVGASVQAERKRHRRGMCTFEMLWMLYKPGIDVYFDSYIDGSYDANVVHSMTGGVSRTSAEPLTLRIWNMMYDGWALGRNDLFVVQPPFEGEKAIMDLRVIPCGFWVEEIGTDNPKPLRTRLEERGRMYYRLTERQCMNFSGYTTKFPRLHVSKSLGNRKLALRI